MSFVPCLFLMVTCLMPACATELSKVQDEKHHGQKLFILEKNSIEVMQNEIILSSRTNNRKTLFTVGLGPCVGLILQSQNQIALAHLDGSLMHYTLLKVLLQMHNDHLKGATIITSFKSNPATITQLKNILTLYSVPFVEKQATDCTAQVAINLASGAIFTDFKYSPPLKTTVDQPKSWNPFKDWTRRSSQYPLLKFLSQGQKDNLIFSPDFLEKQIINYFFKSDPEPNDPHWPKMKHLILTEQQEMTKAFAASHKDNAYQQRLKRCEGE